MSQITHWLQTLPNLQPYGVPQYFAVLLLALLPIVVALFFGRRLPIYESLMSVSFIALMFGGRSYQQLYAFFIYLVWQTSVVFAYQLYRKQFDNKWLFYLSVLLAVAPLIIVKITPAVLGVNSLFGFLGISYLTFRSVAMIMEMWDGDLHGVRFWSFLRFMIFMPTISSGPIDRYRRFNADYQKIPDHETYLNMLEKAVWSLMLGAFYKFILAYFLGEVLLPSAKYLVLAAGGLFNWQILLVMYAYGLNLFFDFAGYSLFAIGISYILCRF
ncbi:hypothetical protein Hs30E_17620 [Lactococcus hodotermopsidis]|uniref:D-alanyl-lipoteichoic acid biosynthesis protein DltB n=1 Tax=Pseudolactococcus hodotermopsidis TaxID=2709157 RepID=A0A6A0BG14_9LACT|nr:hypothetical protein [Lactococcus hodotermopsidis]GFH43211.1 hypothetical protein Hs30E_17620 [Lactococcus hodotermopsidis]